MPAHAKAHHTEIQLIIGKAKPRTFLVPDRRLVEIRGKVAALLDTLNKSDFVPAREVFPELDDASSRPGIVLKGARLRAGLTQGKLAEKIGCEQSDISKLESGHFPIGKARAHKLARVLGMNYKNFL